MKVINIIHNCLQCGTAFKTIPAYIRKGGGKYCSRGCYRNSDSFKRAVVNGGKVMGKLIGVVRNLPRGEKHWAWNPNRTEQMEKHRLRSSKEWKTWQESVFKRDNYSCQQCSNKNCYLEPHHIIPLRSNMGLIFEINNGIALCRPCHKKTLWKEEQFSEMYSRKISEHVAARLH